MSCRRGIAQSAAAGEAAGLPAQQTQASAAGRVAHGQARPKKLPRLFTRDGRGPGVTLLARIRRALLEAGLLRSERVGGGEIMGLTDLQGSTGFSVRIAGEETLIFHVLISGKKAGLTYTRAPTRLAPHAAASSAAHDPERDVMRIAPQVPWRDTLQAAQRYQGERKAYAEEPHAPESVAPQVQAVFEGLGLAVSTVRCVGWQTLDGDEVEFEVAAECPKAWRGDLRQASG